MILDAFTLFHVALSLIGIASGIAVTAGLLSARTIANAAAELIAEAVDR